MNELKAMIEQWATDRNLHTADPAKQMLKLGEEYGELCAGMARSDMEKTADSIGDMFVVMTILCMQLGIDFQKCVQYAYDEIKDRKGKMVDGVFVKEEDLQYVGMCEKDGAVGMVSGKWTFPMTLPHLPLSAPSGKCCDNPNIQTFGPNEALTEPVKVCVNCGRLD